MDTRLGTLGSEDRSRRTQFGRGLLGKEMGAGIGGIEERVGGEEERWVRG